MHHKRPRIIEALDRTPSPRKCSQIYSLITQTSTSPDTEISATSCGDTQLLPLKTSELRPNCSVGERIRKWKPQGARHTLDQNGQPTNLAEEDLTRIQEVLQETYAPNTRSTYGTGLLIFHIFCDHKGISEEHRAPVNQTVLSSFISTLAGTYGGGTIRNYVYGVRAWHIIHGTEWKVNDNEVEALLKAGNKMTPKEARQKEKEPWTVKYLTSICEKLDRRNPKDTAIHACLTTAFWGTARLGEVTVPNLNGFDPALHITIMNVQHDVRDRNNLEETVIFVPWTKAAKEKGEKIFWAKQEGIVDPQDALRNHLAINNPPADGHLFAFKQGSEMRPMTRSIFLTRIGNIVKTNKLPKLPGHGIRVGSTLEYLLRGIPFEVVKAKGRWQSDAFKGYLRKHAQIMAPYMQAEPKTYETFVRYAMPPVR